MPKSIEASVSGLVARDLAMIVVSASANLDSRHDQIQRRADELFDQVGSNGDEGRDIAHQTAITQIRERFENRTYCILRRFFPDGPAGNRKTDQVAFKVVIDATWESALGNRDFERCLHLNLRDALEPLAGFGIRRFIAHAEASDDPHLEELQSVRKLSPRDQIVFLLYRRDGSNDLPAIHGFLDRFELGDILDMTPAAVAAVISRLDKKLRTVPGVATDADAAGRASKHS